MHAEARAFVARITAGHRWRRVLEFGSRNINGGVRDVIAADHYWGLDRQPGPDVDEVVDVTVYRTRRKFDLVVCCEVLEHTAFPQLIVESAGRALKKNGWLIVTCATDPRAPHSGVDGGPVQPGEYYGNVDRGDLESWCRDVGLNILVGELHARGDLYLTAEKA